MISTALHIEALTGSALLSMRGWSRQHQIYLAALNQKLECGSARGKEGFQTVETRTKPYFLPYKAVPPFESEPTVGKVGKWVH